MEAVDWMMARMGLESREGAIKMLQSMLSKNVSPSNGLIGDKILFGNKRRELGSGDVWPWESVRVEWRNAGGVS